MKKPGLLPDLWGLIPKRAVGLQSLDNHKKTGNNPSFD